MEELHKSKEQLITKLKDPKILKKTPTEIRSLRNEICTEFNDVIKIILEHRKKKKTKKKKIVPARIYISDSSEEE